LPPILEPNWKSFAHNMFGALASIRGTEETQPLVRFTHEFNKIQCGARKVYGCAPVLVVSNAAQVCRKPGQGCLMA